MRFKTPAVFAAAMIAASTLEGSGLSTPRGDASHILIPAAIHADGGNGTRFRSDIRITNVRGAAQKIILYWMPAGVGGIESFQFVDLQPGEVLASDDFVGEVLGKSGLGAIGVGGYDESLNPDQGARLHVTSRVWTPQPGTEGTSSQAFTPIPVDDIQSMHVVINGHRRNDQYRTNIGIVNIDEAAHTYVVTVSGETPTLLPEEYRVTVPGESVVQIPTAGAPQNQLRVDIELESGEPPVTNWVAYASSVDNVSGDGWTSVGANVPAN